METCKEARKQGIVGFIGITGLKPRVLTLAIESGEFDTVLVPLNIVTRQALEELLPAAKTQDVGVVVMKPLSAKTSTLITCLYSPSLSLISNEPELKALLGEDKNAMARSALRCALSQEVATVIPGLKTVNEVEMAAMTGNQFKGLTPKEQERFNFNLGKRYCRDCGECFFCKQSINIAAILRFHTLYESYGMRMWARKLYGGLENKADKCTGCRECEYKCPYKLPIMDTLRKAHLDLI